MPPTLLALTDDECQLLHDELGKLVHRFRDDGQHRLAQWARDQAEAIRYLLYFEHHVLEAHGRAWVAASAALDNGDETP